MCLGSFIKVCLSLCVCLDESGGEFDVCSAGLQCSCLTFQIIGIRVVCLCPAERERFENPS